MVRLRPSKTAESPTSAESLVGTSPQGQEAPAERVSKPHGKPAPVDDTPAIVEPDGATEGKLRGSDRAQANVHERGAKAPADATEDATIQRNAPHLKPR